MTLMMIYEDNFDDEGVYDVYDVDPGAVVLALPPVVRPTHHHRVRLHTTKPRCLVMVKIVTTKILESRRRCNKKDLLGEKNFLVKDKQTSWEQDNMIRINLSLERKQKTFLVVGLAGKQGVQIRFSFNQKYL